MSKKTFSQASLEWWVKFDAMKTGTAYEIAKCTKKPELFIAVCMDYIDHSELGYQFEFDEKYLFFKRFTNHVIQKSPVD